jgi:uncharacterized MAPEG superfamily protein
MTIAYACVLLMGLFPYVAAGIAKKGFENFDNSMPRQWLAQQTGFRARANAAQATEVQLKVDKTVAYGSVAEVLAEIQKSELHSVSLAVQSAAPKIQTNSPPARN